MMHKQGDTLIVNVQPDLTDARLEALGVGVSQRLGKNQARNLLLDVSSLDVLDSFATRTLMGIARIARLRGATVVIVGVQPEVAFSMVQLGLGLGDIQTALDLDDGLAVLRCQNS